MFNLILNFPCLEIILKKLNFNKIEKEKQEMTSKARYFYPHYLINLINEEGCTISSINSEN